VVGMDTVRDAPRTFRLSRITGAVKAVGRSGAVTVPKDVRLKDRVVASAGPAEQRSALLKVRTGRAAGLRRGSRLLAAAAGPDDFDQLQVPMPTVWDTARRVAGYGPDALVIDPPELRDAVVGLLRRTVGTDGAAPLDGDPGAGGAQGASDSDGEADR